ncbi:hypothetical protein TSUD_272590 [Trifolium subterraneum]|uniref:YABBY N-terminal domain-containing protein n=1 Tax=Trifolium subterraneum TaxID=3900 RepID=A0A2Z6P092_TRISU|nr:hypothetical protein TSUD_272590 [Trifolium subterraneum]
MSMDMMGTERVCYVHCNFCNTILAVNVPYSSMLTIVTVRCGHCANLLSVNMVATSLQPFSPPQMPQVDDRVSRVMGSRVQPPIST